MFVCVISLDAELTNLKNRRSDLMSSLKNPNLEVDSPQRAGEPELRPLCENIIPCYNCYYLVFT